MKPIIVDMNDMSDSKEVYESKPNHFMIYTIYLIFAILLAAIIWMAFFKIDIVVKSNGIFKGASADYSISSGIAGKIEETHVENGQYVSEGDVLYTLSIDELSETILQYQNELKTAKARIKILSAYEKSLDGNKKELEALSDNPFYDEFINRRELLYANVNLNKNDTEGQAELYQGNIDSISESIDKYNEKIKKLNTVKKCIIARKNSFDSDDGACYSTVNSYIASYNYTSLQYDNQLSDYQRQIDEYTGSEAQKKTMIAQKNSVKKEKSKALKNLELQQISSIEQQISGYDDTILSLKSNLTSAKLQSNTADGSDDETKEKISILTEKGNIAAERLTYEDKAKECENNLRGYDIQNDNCSIKANTSGYFYASQGWNKGSFMQAGTSIGTIYPESESKYYADIYVENEDIAKVKEGQQVKFEVSAYPSSEYGYFKGNVENIAKDITVDQSTGNAYYLVKVKCGEMTLNGKDGKEASLKNGMACQAKIVVDEENVLTYLLKKIDLLD